MIINPLITVEGHNCRMVQDGAFRNFSPSFLSQSELGEIQAGLWRLKQPQKIQKKVS